MKDKKTAAKHLSTTKLAYSIATILFVLGFLLFFYLKSDFDKIKLKETSFFFDKNDDASSLAGMIASTTGLLWSFAGVVLFAFNIRQTQTEIELQISEMQSQGKTFSEQMEAIKSQSKLFEAQAQAAENQSKQYTIQTEALLLQQKENSLNNILNNYFNYIQSFEAVEYDGTLRKITGYQVLNKIHNHLESRFNEYLTYQPSNSFADENIIQYQYNQLWHGVYKSNIQAVIQNFIFMHKFIAQNFKDTELFYERLFNCYSDAEKYIIGMYIINTTNSENAFIQPFNFTNFIQGCIFYDFNLHYLPIIISDLIFYEEIILPKIYSKDLVPVVDYSATLSPISKKLFLEFLIEENQNKDEITVSELVLTYTFRIENSSITKTNKKELDKDNLKFKEKILQVSIRAILLEALEFLADKGEMVAFKSLNVELKSDFEVNIKSHNNSSPLHICFNNDLKIDFNNYDNKEKYLIRPLNKKRALI